MSHSGDRVSPRRVVHLLLLLLSAVLLPASSTLLHTRVPSAWEAVEPADAALPMTFYLSLPNRNVDQLEARLAQLSDPTHPSYGQWLSAADVDAIIAPPAESVDAVTRWVLSSGLPLSHITHHSDALEVQTSVQHVNALFNTSMHHYRHSARGTHGLVAHGHITVPDAVVPHLAMIAGVQNFPFPISRSSVKVMPRSTPFSLSASPRPSSHSFHPLQSPTYYNVMVPRDMASYYGYPDHTQFGRSPNYRANTSIAAAAFDGYNSGVVYESISFADLSSQGNFSDVPGIQSTPSVYGHNVQSSPQLEPSLDSQAVTANNPVANFTHWEENYQTWMYGLCLHLLAQPTPPQVVSISWLTSEVGADNGNPDGISGGYATYIAQTEVKLTALGAMGVTVIAASGDEGANGLQNRYCVYQGGATAYDLYVSWPASSPHVVSVGATQLNGPTGTYNEASTPWCGLQSTALPSGYSYNTQLATPFELGCITGGTEVAAASNFRSGGGFSRVYAQPAWQASAVSAYLNSTGVTFPPASYYSAGGAVGRGVPDLAMYGEGMPIVHGGTIDLTGGTSLATPLFAVVVSLLNEVSLNAGGSTLGFLNPLLYYMAANVSGTFKDITTGDNVETEDCLVSSTCSGATPCNCTACQGFYATTGWDAVTGLGSPVYSNMAAYVQLLAAGLAAPTGAAPPQSSSSSAHTAEAGSSSSLPTAQSSSLSPSSAVSSAASPSSPPLSSAAASGALSSSTAPVGVATGASSLSSGLMSSSVPSSAGASATSSPAGSPTSPAARSSSAVSSSAPSSQSSPPSQVASSSTASVGPQPSAVPFSSSSTSSNGPSALTSSTSSSSLSALPFGASSAPHQRSPHLRLPLLVLFSVLLCLVAL